MRYVRYVYSPPARRAARAVTLRTSRPRYVPQTWQAWWDSLGERHWGQTTRLGLPMAIWLRLRPWRDFEVFFFGSGGIGQLPSSSFVFSAASVRQAPSLSGGQAQ